MKRTIWLFLVVLGISFLNLNPANAETEMFVNGKGETRQIETNPEEWRTLTEAEKKVVHVVSLLGVLILLIFSNRRLRLYGTDDDFGFCTLLVAGIFCLVLATSTAIPIIGALIASVYGNDKSKFYKIFFVISYVTIIIAMFA